MTSVSISGKPQTNEEKVVFNVSGLRFETLRKTLRKYPETLLGSEKCEEFYDVINKEFFFDRDPKIFRHIINYYQSDILHCSPNVCVKSYDEELKFFGLSPTIIGECCFEDYQDRKLKNTEKLLTEESIHSFEESIPENIKERMWKAFEIPHSSTGALIFHYASGLFIAFSLLLMILETRKNIYFNHLFLENRLELCFLFTNLVPCGFRPGRASQISCGERFKLTFFCLEAACILIFTIEYLLRLYAAPLRLKFLKSVFSIIDIIAILPFYLEFFVDTYDIFNTVAIFRVLRFLRFFRNSEASKILGQTLKTSAAEIKFLVFMLTIAIVIFSTVMFFIERHEDGTSFTSIHSSILISIWITFGNGSSYMVMNKI